MTTISKLTNIYEVQTLTRKQLDKKISRDEVSKLLFKKLIKVNKKEFENYIFIIKMKKQKTLQE